MANRSHTVVIQQLGGKLEHKSGPVKVRQHLPGLTQTLDWSVRAVHQPTCIQSEKWHDIPGNEGRYAVSSAGRVKNLRSGKFLKPFVGDNAGHLRVDLPNGKHYVHVLVAEAFIGTRPEGLEVCHGDNNPTNNRVENLRWDTRSENVMDLRADKVKCRHGHPWVLSNIYTDPNGWQSCRTCRRLARAEYRKKVRNRG